MKVSVSGGGSAASAATDSTNVPASAVSPFFTTEVGLGSGVYYMMFWMALCLTITIL
jgi:hypothetical protein